MLQAELLLQRFFKPNVIAVALQSVENVTGQKHSFESLRRLLINWGKKSWFNAVNTSEIVAFSLFQVLG